MLCLNMLIRHCLIKYVLILSVNALHEGHYKLIYYLQCRKFQKMHLNSSFISEMQQSERKYIRNISDRQVINMNIFEEQKSEDCMKPGSKYLFRETGVQNIDMNKTE